MNQVILSPAKRPVLVSNLISQFQFQSTSRYQSSWDSYDQPPNRPVNNQFMKPKQNRFPPSQPPTEKELVKRGERRIQRAERLERKDLTAQLTETKTYMGGFTQPRHLAFLNTLDPTRKEKDSYAVRAGKDRVRPSQEAYEPHVVYLAVTRYPVKWEPGRATRRECFSGFCAESELAERFQKLNYGAIKQDYDKKGNLVEKVLVEGEEEVIEYTCPTASKEYCDLAVWPGSPEARSMFNKRYYRAKKSNDKGLAAMEKAIEAGTPFEDFTPSPLPERLPPIENWTRPPPPYLDHRLIVPFLTVTLPTRPLAATLARLCNAHPRGLPFFASVPPDDRKDGPDFFRRLLRMRSNRIQELTGNIIEKLDGFGGGLFGLRLNSEDKGRGVDGEALGEELRRPEGGWAEVRWLNEDSDVWEGIEKETFIESWDTLEGARRGISWDERGVPVSGKGSESTQEKSRVDKVLDFMSEPATANESERAAL